MAVRVAVLVALGGCGSAVEGPQSSDASTPGLDDAASCTGGALRSCVGCGVGTLRTNLPGVQRCISGPVGAAWGACECRADAGL